jgi:hypothetical protein
MLPWRQRSLPAAALLWRLVRGPTLAGVVLRLRHQTMLLLALLVAIAVVLARPLLDRPSGRVPASWARTPGVLNGDVTQATLAATICRPGWTRAVRPPVTYTSQLKLEQMREYGFGGSPTAYQEDHLISLELGGHPTDRRNLWPEPIEQALADDAVENELHRRVCAGELTLAEAQRRESALKH